MYAQPFVGSVCWSMVTPISKDQSLALRRKAAGSALSSPALALLLPAEFSFLLSFFQNCWKAACMWSRVARGFPAAQGFSCCRFSVQEWHASCCWQGSLFPRNVTAYASVLYVSTVLARAGFLSCRTAVQSRTSPRSIAAFSKKHRICVACGVQFFCTFTSTSNMLWK